MDNAYSEKNKLIGSNPTVRNDIKLVSRKLYKIRNAEENTS